MKNDLEGKCALFSYVGHAGRQIDTPFTSFLIFPHSRLYSQCSSDDSLSRGNLCLDYDSMGVARSDTSKLFMDDVLLAVLLGCRTDVKSDDSSKPSTADRFISHGVDCVIGTKGRVDAQMMNFWYYRFYQLIADKRNTIAYAMREAYISALDDIRNSYPQLGPTATFAAIQGLFGSEIDEENGRPYNPIETFEKTFSIKDNINNETVSTLSALPARYGTCQICK